MSPFGSLESPPNTQWCWDGVKGRGVFGRTGVWRPRGRNEVKGLGTNKEIVKSNAGLGRFRGEKVRSGKSKTTSLW